MHQWQVAVYDEETNVNEIYAVEADNDREALYTTFYQYLKLQVELDNIDEEDLHYDLSKISGMSAAEIKEEVKGWGLHVSYPIEK